MSKSKKARHLKSVGNQSGSGAKIMRPYYSNARFIEIGTSKQPFRSFINVDHIINIRFEQAFKEIDIEIEPAINVDGEGKGRPAVMGKKAIPCGWAIIVIVGSQTQRINFDEYVTGIDMYNQMLGQIRTLGVPCCTLPALTLPKQEDSPLVPEQEEEDPLLALVDDLPELTDEELDQLDHPVREDGGLLHHPITELDELVDALGEEEDPDKPGG